MGGGLIFNTAKLGGGSMQIVGKPHFHRCGLGWAAHPTQIMTRSHFNVEAGLVIAMHGDSDDGPSNTDNFNQTMSI